MIVETSVIVFAGVCFVILAAVGYAARSSRLLWLETVIEGATENLRQKIFALWTHVNCRKQNTNVCVAKNVQEKSTAA